jgi:hypothetical protein
MPRVAKPYDPARIAHLKDQIRDPGYVEGAIERLAGRITDRLLGLEEHPEYSSGGYGPTRYRPASSSSIANAVRLRSDE